MTTTTTCVMPQKVCDFCSMASISWQYPARSFDAMRGVFTFRSIGEWNACETCHDLIEGENWTRLANRCAEHFCKHRMQHKACSRLMLKLHRKFARHRTGDAFRIDH
jgi:hypothetical protein